MSEGNPQGFSLNDDQWSFIFLHYPEYAQAPYDMMCWLFGQASEKEEADKALLKQDESDEEVERPSKGPRKILTTQDRKRMEAEKKRKKEEEEKKRAEAAKLKRE